MWRKLREAIRVALWWTFYLRSDPSPSHASETSCGCALSRHERDLARATCSSTAIGVRRARRGRTGDMREGRPWRPAVAASGREWRGAPTSRGAVLAVLVHEAGVEGGHLGDDGVHVTCLGLGLGLGLGIGIGIGLTLTLTLSPCHPRAAGRSYGSATCPG